MFPLGFLFGAVAGAAALLVFRPQVTQYARPVAKAVLKAALTAMHEAQVQGAEVVEAAEDLYAEAKAEVTAEVFAAAMAEAQAQARTASAAPPEPAKPKQEAGGAASFATVKRARKPAAIKRSSPVRRGK
jgi:gas vesicle protein